MRLRTKIVLAVFFPIVGALAFTATVAATAAQAVLLVPRPEPMVKFDVKLDLGPAASLGDSGKEKTLRARGVARTWQQGRTLPSDTDDACVDPFPPIARDSSKQKRLQARGVAGTPQQGRRLLSAAAEVYVDFFLPVAREEELRQEHYWKTGTVLPLGFR